MSSGDLTRNRSSSPRVGVSVRTSGSQEILDPAQILLPPSETGSSRGTEVQSHVFFSTAAVAETKTLTQNINPTQIPPLPSEARSVRGNEPVTIPGTAPPPPELPDDVDEDEKRSRAMFFMWEVYNRDVRNIIFFPFQILVLSTLIISLISNDLIRQMKLMTRNGQSH
uniref:Uncharacterized protein n=1 Tax=Moniliophthora roreri TaxID=221103 RepID=A0A0W0FP77_MONRR